MARPNYTDADFKRINSEIANVYERIGRVVVYSEQIRFNLMTVIAHAGADPMRRGGDWKALTEQTHEKFAHAQIPEVVKEFSKSVKLFYGADSASCAVVDRVAGICLGLNTKRNAIVHSVWAVGWNLDEKITSVGSVKYLREQKSFAELGLASRLDEAIWESGIVLTNLASFFWQIFQCEPLVFEGEPDLMFRMANKPPASTSN